MRSSPSVVRRLSLLLAVLLCAAGRTPATGQSLEELANLGVSIPTDPRNAATWYVRAIDALSRVDRATRFNLANWNYTTAPSRALRRDLRAHAAVLDDVEAATARSFCDFELRYEQGWEILLPHLGQLRAIARVMRVRAAVAIHDGQAERAARDIERIQRMAIHASGDDTLISSLVSMAIASLGDELIDVGFRRGVFGPAEAAMLLGVSSELAAPGAFRLRSAIAMEGRIADSWLRDRLVDASSGDRMSFMTEMLGGEPESESLRRLTEAPADELGAEVDRLSEAYERIDEVFAVVDEDPELAAELASSWEDRIGEGEFGELAKTFMPSISRILVRAREDSASMQEREAMLRGVIAGDPAGRRLDAALHLREAIRAAAAIPDDVAELIELGGGIGGDDEAADVARVALTSMLSQLDSAAKADHFDEMVLRVDGDSRVLPAWAGPARRVLGLLAGEAERARRGEALGEAARLTTIGLRLVRHLSTSRSMVASRLAQEHLEQLVPLVRGMPEAIRADEGVWSLLAAAGDAIVSRPDEEDRTRARQQREHLLLGYDASTREGISTVAQAVTDLRRRVDGLPPEWGSADSETQDLDGDMVVVLLLATERVAGACTAPAAPPAGTSALPEDEEPAADDAPVAADTDRLPRIPGLDGIVDDAALLALEARVPAIRRALVAREKPVPLIAGAEPSPLDVRRHQREARRLIRELHLAIDPARAAKPAEDEPSS